MGICKNITNIISPKKQDIEPYFMITKKEWDDRLNHIDNLDEKLFGWDKISRRDSEKLIGFLKDEFGIDWIRPEQIRKVDSKNIKATNESESILLNISDDEKKVTLYIDNEKKDEFKVKKEKNKLNVYNESIEKIPEKDFTFILACAYAIDGTVGCNSLLKIVCAHELPDDYENSSNPIWFEAMPLKGISSPTLDMAFGNLQRPNGDNTKAQIIYRPPPNGSSLICFVEMKIGDDLVISSTDNPTYNQLAKYIRSALIFQNAGNFPKEVHVTLVTPRIFIKNLKSRFYGYKFIEYACPQINPENIMPDIPIRADSPQHIENEKLDNNWSKCDKDGMIERFPYLKLHWIPYENLLDNIPNTNPLKKYIDKIREANPIFDKPSESNEEIQLIRRN
jgi:hypothetical protein